jgi:hypothetical protein
LASGGLYHKPEPLGRKTFLQVFKVFMDITLGDANGTCGLCGGDSASLKDKSKFLPYCLCALGRYGGHFGFLL